MQLEFDPQLEYTCVQCGRSCTGWNVWLSADTARQLERHPLTLRVIQERGQAFVAEEAGLKMYRETVQQPCGFLREDKLCGIHAELGYQAKPVGCKQFPIFFTRLPDGTIRVSASFACKAVRERLGPPLEAQRESALELLREGATVHAVPDWPEVAPERVASWNEVQGFERAMELQVAELGWEAALPAACAGLARALASEQPLTQAFELPLPESLQQTLWLIRTVLTLGLLKPCLYDNDRDLWRQIDAGFLGESDLVIPEFGWSGPVADLEQWVQGGVAGRFTAELDRYRSALWYRKAHLTVGGLLPGLLMLWSAAPLLDLLAGLYAWKRQAQPELQDYQAALDLVETSLVAHSGNGALVYRPLALHLLQAAR